jgi:Ca-activated chloride channel family protein
MSFEYPLAFLLLLPLLYCLYRCKEKIKQRYFVHLHLFSPAKRPIRWEWILIILTLVALVTALASPIYVDRSDPLNRKGIDIVLSLDGSGSMNASGFDAKSRENRFEITQKIAQDFVMRRTEDNVGVVLFGDFAFIASPVTYEKEIVAEMIGYLSHGMAGENTAIGEGVTMGLRALQRSKAAEKVIILLTDGEHNSGRVSPKEAVTMAKEAGVRLYTIGIGNRGEFDEAMLKTMAKESGGRFFPAYDKEELKEVYNSIDALERSAIKSREYLKKEYYFAPVLMVAFVLMLFLYYKKERA